MKLGRGGSSASGNTRVRESLVPARRHTRGSVAAKSRIDRSIFKRHSRPIRFKCPITLKPIRPIRRVNSRRFNKCAAFARVMPSARGRRSSVGALGRVFITRRARRLPDRIVRERRSRYILYRTSRRVNSRLPPAGDLNGDSAASAARVF